MTGYDLEILETVEGVGERAAALTEQLAKQRIATAGRFTMALSGGSTPKLYHRALVARGDALDWSCIHVLWSDDRAVPADHEHSNYRMAKETLLDDVPVPEQNVHRIEADEGDHVKAAKAYETVLVEVAQGMIDLVLLGMGDDGHTASLFPGREPEEKGLVLAAKAPAESPVERRVTFSYGAIERARNVVVLISGAGKADRLREVLLGEGDLPMQKVLAKRKSNTWILVDEPAASKLPEETRKSP